MNTQDILNVSTRRSLGVNARRSLNVSTRHMLMVFVASGGLAVGSGGCAPSGGATTSRPTSGPASQPVLPVQVQAARSEVAPARIPLVGTLHAAEEVVIATKVAGVLHRTFLEAGALAPPGTPLTQVDPLDYELAVAQAQAARAEVLARLDVAEVPDESFDVARVSSVARAAAQLENARFTYDRVVKMDTAYSDQELSDVQARLRVAEAEYQTARSEAAALVATARARDAQLKLAQAALRDAQTVAPPIPSTLGAAGADHWVVAERLVTEGQYLDAAQSLYRLVVSDPLKLRARIPERYAHTVHVGDRVELESGEDAAPLRGAVVRVSPTIDTASRTFEVEAYLANAGDVLKPGTFTKGTLVSVDNTPAVFVPTAAVLTDGGTPRVYVVEGGVARRRAVRVGRQVGDQFEIQAGLKEGEQVVTTGAAALSDGAPVEVRRGS